MRTQVLAVMAGQHGLITRRQALDAGLAPDRVRRLVRGRAWVAVRRGVYADSHHWDSLDEWTGRPRLRVHAVHLCLTRDHVMSHDSSALLQGIPVLLGDPQIVHVTRPGVTGSRNEYGVKHHLAPFTEREVVEIEGVRCLGPVRTALDICREHGRDHGVVACDAVLRRGVALSELTRLRSRMRCWPGVTSVDDALEISDAGAESPGESLARILVHELGIGRPQTQFELRDESRQVFCDMRVGRHIFEFDGRIKYRGHGAGGVAARPGDDVLWAEKRRQDFVCGFKLGMSRIVWADLWGEQRRVAKARLRREYADTVVRFGTDTSDLPGAID